MNTKESRAHDHAPCTPIRHHFPGRSDCASFCASEKFDEWRATRSRIAFASNGYFQAFRYRGRGRRTHGFSYSEPAAKHRGRELRNLSSLGNRWIVRMNALALR